MIRENDVFSRVISIVRTALESMGIAGCDVLQQNQPTPTSSHACVLVSKVDMRRYGWQGSTYDNDTGSDDTVNENWDWNDELTFQVSAYHPRKTSDAVGSLTSYDILTAVAAWMQSPVGIRHQLSKSVQPLRITEIRNPVQADDSNIPQFNPNFDYHFIVRQVAKIQIPAIMDIGSRGLEGDADTKTVNNVDVHRGDFRGVGIGRE